MNLLRLQSASLPVVLLLLSGCGGSPSNAPPACGFPCNPVQQTATPTITTTPALNGAVIVSLADASPGATLYYTTNNTVPNTQSAQYITPFLIASQVTLQVIAVAAGDTASAIASQSFVASIPSGTLVWSDEFDNPGTAPAQPNPAVWTYDTGNSGFGNNELEDYCAWGSNTAPCSTSSPNAYVGTDGYLHLVAEQPSSGVYTSARLKSQGLFSFQYGRLEIRASVPEAQGFWPAAWLMGNNIATINWPGCGEMDVLERVNAATTPDFNDGSVHGPGFTGINLGTQYLFPAGQTASTFHIYGMIWSPGSVSYYIDSPANIYATYTPAKLTGLSGATWPFDGGQANFILLNLAIGGSFPGPPTSATPFPSQMLVDYVRLYSN